MKIEQIKSIEDNQKEDNLKRVQNPLNFFIKKGFLLDNDLLNFFTRLEDNEFSEEILERISSLSKTRIITRSSIAAHFKEVKSLILKIKEDKKEIVENFFKTITSKEISEKNKDIGQKPESSVKLDFKMLSSNIIPDRKIEVKDFVTHFKNRYNSLKDILKSREGLNNLISIDKIGNSRDFSIIGLVLNKRITKNKNYLLEVEDLTGRATTLISQNKPEVTEKVKEILLDDVIGLKCSGTRDMIFVKDIFFPDCGIPEKKKIDEECYALFTSDIHLGSSNFLEKNFSKFIEWLNGENCDEYQKNKLKKIKYLFIVGDNVDGVGVNPGQLERLTITDIKKQYSALAHYLNKIPKHITVIMCPGQHDSSRVPEPQPPIDKEFAEDLFSIKNLVLVSNPSTIEIECSSKKSGLKVLMYHGASLHNWIDEIEDLRTTKTNLNPAKAVKYLLKHRHLSPTHSATTYVPVEKEDPMVIKYVPDIIVTGDMHRSDIDAYNNILIICSSCWQSTTPFEEKVGNEPDPCKVPMLNLKTREIKILDFSDKREEK